MPYPDPFTGRLTSTGNVAQGMVIQPDGRIVVAGQGFRGGFSLVRYTADGNLDPGFAGGGIMRDELGTSGDFAESVALLPDGRIVVGGYAAVPDANGMARGTDFAVAATCQTAARTSASAASAMCSPTSAL